MKFILVIVLSVVLATALSADPTNYEYYTKGGIKEGLKAEGEHFTLNGRQIRLLSGAMHYFRFPQQYWRDRLRKFKAAGLNTVQSYAPWNLHEEHQGHFDFETGYLNLADLFKAAKEEDMFVYLRIGPFICAEFEFGGYPSWLLKDRNMRFRSTYKGFLDPLEKYFKKVMEIVNEHQFTKGGSVIALQFENEYGGIRNKNDQEYFDFMKNVIDKSGFKGLLSNCDNNPAYYAAQHTQPGVLETLNWASSMYSHLMTLKKAQPNKPLHVTEFWNGWMDRWGDHHHTMALDKFAEEVYQTLFEANSSITFYPMIGGTNFNFNNGGDGQRGVTTSYDFNAPISESGNYTDKYWKARELILRLTKERNFPKIHIPDPPKVELAVGYGDIKVKDYLNFEDIVSLINPKTSTDAKPMEDFDQTFGYILYRSSQKKFKHLKIQKGVYGVGIVMVDNKAKTTVEPQSQTHNDVVIDFTDADFDSKTNDHKLDVFVENQGRADFNSPTTQYRGLYANLIVDNKEVKGYRVYNMDFKEEFVRKAKTMKGRTYQKGFKQQGPTLYRAQLEVKGQPKDTFIRTDNWNKGIVLVNGFNIGRYYNIGPQKTLYLPAPFLKSGTNDILIFEYHSSTDHIQSVDKPDFGKV